MEDYRHRLQVSNWRKQDNVSAIKIGLKHELLLAHIPRKAIYNLYLLLCQEMEQPGKVYNYDYVTFLHFSWIIVKIFISISFYFPARRTSTWGAT